MKRVFIDGSSGTTGLRIRERLSAREDIDLIMLPDEKRKDTDAKKQALNECDIAFLCLPDAAAAESVGLIENPSTAVIDTSTAHRVSEGWTYGFAEIGSLRKEIAASRRVTNPGCHASGFIALIRPLIEAGIISPDEQLICFSLTGYSGGGKKMIAEYEAEERNPLLDAPRMYGLGQQHKHLPEMQKVCGLNACPAFCPIVAPYFSGMEVTVPLFGKNRKVVEQVYSDYYKNGLVRFAKDESEDGFLSAGLMSGRDDMTVSVYGNDERLILVSRFDNLGKGASGAAIQNMNIMLGLNEYTGLVI